jgi:hypothetical protein
MDTLRGMSMNAGVWIDHRKAQIVALNPDGRFTTVILSRVARHPERGADSPMRSAFEARQVPADDRRQRSLMGELNRYYDAVIEALHDYGMLLVFGPGEAKGELHARLLKKKLAARVSAVETADQMTDRQIVAKVRAHFRDAAPRVHMPFQS